MNKKTLRLVECSVLIGLAVALSFVKLFKLYLGGSVTLCSMLPLMLISYRHGVKWGLSSGFIYSIIHLTIGITLYGDLVSWGLSSQILIGSAVFDYLIAFTVIGLAGMFGTKFPQYVLGMIVCVLFRYISHVISGVIFFGNTVPDNFNNPLVYSLAYNSFLFADLGICLAAGIALYFPLKKYIQRVKI